MLCAVPDIVLSELVCCGTFVVGVCGNRGVLANVVKRGVMAGGGGGGLEAEMSCSCRCPSKKHQKSAMLQPTLPRGQYREQYAN